MTDREYRGRTRLPLIDVFDAIVSEGTVAGIEIALELAQHGHRVAVVGSGTSFPYEIVSCMRAWIPDAADASRLSGRFGRLVMDSLKDDGTVHLGKISEAVEDALIDAGVSFYYNAHPVGVLRNASAAVGLVVGGKFGLAALGARLIVDTTPWALVVRSAGVGFARRELASQTVSCVFHVAHADSDCSVESAQGWSAELHAPYVELRVSWDGRVESDLWYSRAVLDAHTRLLDDDDELRAFRESLDVTRGADDVSVSPVHRLERPEGPADALTPQAMRAPEAPEMLVCGPSAAISDKCAVRLATDWAYALEAAVDVAGDIASSPSARNFDSDSLSALLRDSSELALGSAASVSGDVLDPSSVTMHVVDPGFDQPGAPLISVDLPPIPIGVSTDAVVAGAGTAGVPAATVAAELGTRVVCTEQHADPGGANTTGGVAHYWFGRWSPFFKQHFQRLRKRNEDTALPPSFAQLGLMIDSGVDVLPRLVAVGSATQPAPAPGSSFEGGHRRVTAVLAATANGLIALRGDYFVDATGDGDVAAWSGAPYTYGSERDYLTLWCSFGKFHGGQREASRQYLTVVDQRDIADTTRAIVAGRRQTGIFGEAEYPQHYLVTREARHIQAPTRVRYLDMLMDVDYPDSAFVCRANVDLKGLGSSDASLAGFVEPKVLGNFFTHVPYSAMTPVSVENLIIAGKAYSITHDGMAMARMQSDMITMGAVAGSALDFVRRRQLAFAEAPVSVLQKTWLELGTIEASELVPRRDHCAHGLSDFDLETLCHRVALGPVEMDDEARILAQGRRAIPYLKAALASAVARRGVVLARMLCALGDGSANDILLAHLDGQLGADRLPTVTNRRHIFPDNGIAPEPTFVIQALALTREPRLVLFLERVADRLECDPHQADSMFTYVYAICYAAERLASDDVVPVLLRVLAEPAVSGRVMDPGEDLRRGSDPVADRYAYLELSAYRALARCGKWEGWEGLVSYLQDHRSFVNRSARDELRDLAGCDFAFDSTSWLQWLEQSDAWSRKKPLTRRFE